MQMKHVAPTASCCADVPLSPDTDTGPRSFGSFTAVDWRATAPVMAFCAPATTAGICPALLSMDRTSPCCTAAPVLLKHCNRSCSPTPEFVSPQMLMGGVMNLEGIS